VPTEDVGEGANDIGYDADGLSSALVGIMRVRGSMYWV
jgi:hypothetical protein